MSDSTDHVECPGCGRRLELPGQVRGEIVQCPQCRHTFVAPSRGAPLRPPPAPSPAPAPPAPPPRPRAEEPRTPWRRRRYDADDLDSDSDDLDVSTSERYLHPHRGTLILTYGLLSLFLFCLPILGGVFGILAIVQGGNDLAAMQAGRMDREGVGTTRTGRTLGAFGLLLSLGMFLFFCLAGLGRR